MNLCSRRTFRSPAWDGLCLKAMAMLGCRMPRSGARVSDSRRSKSSAKKVILELD